MLIKKNNTYDKVTITVVGLGYVGMAYTILLARNNRVIATDISEKKVDSLNKRISPIHDELIQEHLCSENLDIIATLDADFAYREADYVLICTSTDYDNNTICLNTVSVENVINRVSEANPESTVIIKSTVPIGFTKMMNNTYPSLHLLFSPEFLREGTALFDVLYPSRIVIGINNSQKKANDFVTLLINASEKNEIPVLIVSTDEAESIKLFANTYLALRIAFFNELDTFSEINNLDTKAIIDGIGFDSRIGMYYNNPSFGYGGYCLPKDSKQLLANYQNVPENIIKSIIQSNNTRKNFIVNSILDRARAVCRNLDSCIVGIYRVTMKSGSDNIRNSAIIDIIKMLKKKHTNMIIYEPSISGEVFLGCRIESNISKFKTISSIIVANRHNLELDDVKEKVYTRDIYRIN
jgi:UDPglucose 6-dehydrogenase